MVLIISNANSLLAGMPTRRIRVTSLESGEGPAQIEDAQVQPGGSECFVGVSLELPPAGGPGERKCHGRWNGEGAGFGGDVAAETGADQGVGRGGLQSLDPDHRTGAPPVQLKVVALTTVGCWYSWHPSWLVGSES